LGDTYKQVAEFIAPLETNEMFSISILCNVYVIGKNIYLKVC